MIAYTHEYFQPDLPIITHMSIFSLISLSVHTQILQKRWHQILLLSTSVNQAWEQMEAQKHNPRLRRRDIQQQLVRIVHSLTIRQNTQNGQKEDDSTLGKIREFLNLFCKKSEIFLFSEKKYWENYFHKLFSFEIEIFWCAANNLMFWLVNMMFLAL